MKKIRFFIATVAVTLAISGAFAFTPKPFDDLWYFNGTIYIHVRGNLGAPGGYLCTGTSPNCTFTRTGAGTEESPYVYTPTSVKGQYSEP